MSFKPDRYHGVVGVSVCANPKASYGSSPGDCMNTVVVHVGRLFTIEDEYYKPDDFKFGYYPKLRTFVFRCLGKMAYIELIKYKDSFSDAIDIATYARLLNSVVGKGGIALFGDRGVVCGYPTMRNAHGHPEKMDELRLSITNGNNDSALLNENGIAVEEAKYQDVPIINDDRFRSYPDGWFLSKEVKDSIRSLCASVAKESHR